MAFHSDQETVVSDNLRSEQLSICSFRFARDTPKMRLVSTMSVIAWYQQLVRYTNQF